MLKHIHITSLDFYKIWNAVTKLYLSNPIRHAYLLFDLIYYSDKSDIHILLKNNEICGYLLVWKGAVTRGVHIWGDAESLIKYLPANTPMIIQIYSEKLLNPILNHLKPLDANINVITHFDMQVDEQSFRPYNPERAVQITDNYLKHFIELKKVQGRVLDEKTAKDIILNWKYYGFFVNDKLVSIACAYIRLNEAWAIGDVYTHSEFRGKGYAKIVTSAITQKAIMTGARAYLHVRKDNAPAISVYKTLGYRVFDERPWIFYNIKQ